MRRQERAPPPANRTVMQALIRDLPVLRQEENKDTETPEPRRGVQGAQGKRDASDPAQVSGPARGGKVPPKIIDQQKKALAEGATGFLPQVRRA